MPFRLSGERLDRPVVLYVGRLSPERDLEVLCTLADTVPGARRRGTRYRLPAVDSGQTASLP